MDELKIQLVKRKKKETEADGVTTVAKALAPQLGSDQKHLVQQTIDERKFAVLNDMTQAALGHFAYRAKVDHIRYFDHMIKWDLVSTQAIGGLARRQAIQMVNAAAGGGKAALDVVDRPNILARNITNRQWKEKATKEGKVVVQ